MKKIRKFSIIAHKGFAYCFVSLNAFVIFKKLFCMFVQIVIIAIKSE